MSNCYISLEEVTIVVTTPDTITSCNYLGIRSIYSSPIGRFNKSSFENLEDELTIEGKNEKHTKNSRIFEFGNRIRIFEWNANIRITEYSLTSLICSKLL